MTTTAAHAFVIALGRVSALAKHRFLRNLQPADQDDVLATAILWCWEHQDTYTPAIALEQWFLGAVRHALRDWRRSEAREAAELVSMLPAPDDTLSTAEVRSSAEVMARTLTAQDQQIAVMRAEGKTRADIRRELRVSSRDLSDANKRLQRLRTLVPDASELRSAQRTPPAPDEYEGPWREPSSIDRKIEASLHPVPYAPPSYADDYRMGPRRYVKEEDIRSDVIRDYEENPGNRRLLLVDGRWIAEVGYLRKFIQF